MKKARKNSKQRKIARERQLQREMRQDYDYHLPVMLTECCDWLITDPSGTYVEGTLGGGGHTTEILRRLSDKGRIISFDADIEAINYCKEKFSSELEKGDESKLILRHKNFFHATELEDFFHGKINGVLLDLGVSSRQLDTEHRGFSYRTEAELDMRFGSEGRTAAEILNEESEDELVRIFREYGEDPFSRQIARKITERRKISPLETTQDLRKIVEEIVPHGAQTKSLARIFQAVRIAVNRELEILEETLRGIIPLLAPGGRIVVLSYHSLEDRIVKNVFREEGKKSFKEGEKISVPLKILTPRPIDPDDEEILRNPRARSAKLRVAEKL